MREWVFANVLMVTLPAHIRQDYFPDIATFAATVYFLGFVLRLWTLVGEIILWGTSLLVDYRGALNRPNAPGRVAVQGS